jgi:hypothetical protein
MNLTKRNNESTELELFVGKLVTVELSTNTKFLGTIESISNGLIVIRASNDVMSYISAKNIASIIVHGRT